jgi:hypothetical protein
VNRCTSVADTYIGCVEHIISQNELYHPTDNPNATLAYCRQLATEAANSPTQSRVTGFFFLKTQPNASTSCSGLDNADDGLGGYLMCLANRFSSTDSQDYVGLAGGTPNDYILSCTNGKNLTTASVNDTPPGGNVTPPETNKANLLAPDPADDLIGTNLCAILNPDPESDIYKVCDKCQSGGQLWTAIGCLPTDMGELAIALVTFLLGVAGLFFIMQVLYGSFKMIVSRGDPRGVQEAKERITNSVIALLFVIFSVTILRFVGVNVFKLPGFFD